MTQDTDVKVKRKRSGCFWRFLLWGFLLLVLTGSVLAYLWFSKPTYWRTYDANDPVLSQQGQALENRLPTQITEVRPLGEPWQLTITQEEVNGWIVTRLPKWLANRRQMLKKHKLPTRIPEEVEHIMVAIEPKFVALAAKIEGEKLGQVISFEFKPFIGDNQLARLDMIKLKGGRLWLPQGMIERVVQKYGSMENAEQKLMVKFREMLRQTDLAWPADEHRIVEVMNIKLRKGVAELTCRTVLKKNTVAVWPWQEEKDTAPKLPGAAK